MSFHAAHMSISPYLKLKASRAAPIGKSYMKTIKEMVHEHQNHDDFNEGDTVAISCGILYGLPVSLSTDLSKPENERTTMVKLSEEGGGLGEKFSTFGSWVDRTIFG